MGELWGRTFKKPLLYCFNWAATCANETQVGVPQRAPGLPGQCRPAMPRRPPKSLQERCHFKEKMEKSKWDHITVEQLKPVALGQKKKSHFASTTFKEHRHTKLYVFLQHET